MTTTSPFLSRNFRKLFAAQVTSLAGSGLATVALALLAYDIAGGSAGLILGTALAVKMIAYVLIAPVAGAYSERLPRRRLLITLDIVRAAIVCMLPFVTEVWQVYILIFGLSACAAVFTPTYQATIPEVLPDDEQYTRALSYSRLAYDLESLASPAMAAVALLFLSYDMLFAINGLTFLLSAALVFSTTISLPQRRDSYGTIWQELSLGIRFYLATPRLRGLLALSFAVACGGAMVIVNTVVLVRDALGGSETDTAIMLAFYGCGSMIVALTLPKYLDTGGDRIPMLMGAFLIGVVLCVGALSTTFIWFCFVWLLLGAASSLIQTPSGRLLKRSSHQDNRTAVYAAQFALSHGCWLIAYPLAGWVRSTQGLDAAFVVFAFLAITSCIAAGNLWKVDERVIAHTHGSMSHSHTHVHDEHHEHEHGGWEGPEPHEHQHDHQPISHEHAYVIDRHHLGWPDR